MKHTSPVNYAEFSYDGTMIVTALDDVKVWFADTLKIYKVLNNFKGKVILAKFNDHDNYVAAGSEANEVKLWRLG